MDNAEEIVKVKLADAGLTLSKAELDRYVAGYPTQRAAVESLYALELDDVQPAIEFDPTAV
ncbi:MAG: hypothetical protein JWM12_659 [Ilumatobacteraceae bacterium]|jgi:hypothetical protein|nr:hypothetical protein [Ilumatobacteraceae bacterium]